MYHNRGTSGKIKACCVYQLYRSGNATFYVEPVKLECRLTYKSS